MENKIRINKYIAQSGLCSRREADKLIEQGLVFVNGTLAESGMQVGDSDVVTVNNNKVTVKEEKVYLAFNKPRGIVCTSEKKEKNNIIDYINYERRLTYAGRLDKDSEGLLILTDDGDLIDKMMRARNKHEKEYVVTVERNFDDNFIKEMAGGVYIEELDRTTRKCSVVRISGNSFKIILTEGLNRQIRRMCDTLGYKVTSLKRIRVCNVVLGDLKTGELRKISGEELKELFKITDYKLEY